MTGVQGRVDPAFEAVREVFAANLSEGRDLGASVAVCVDGHPVVDLWGGVADERTGRAWEQDTACVVFSCTKALTATAALAVARDVGIDPDEPVARWWPEYAVEGKESTTLSDMLTHRAGLPVFEQPITVAEAADPELMARTLAAQRPIWQPGSEHGYHALTFGWLVGEFVRRQTHSTVGDYVRGHFGADLRIGVSADEAARAARLARPPAAEMAWTGDIGSIDAAAAARLAEVYRDPESLLMRSSSNPAAAYNHSDVLAGGWPASGLVVTARALAGFYRDLVAGKLLPQAVLAEATRERVRGVDTVLQLETAFGWGYMLPSQNFVLPDTAAATAFGHPGAGGSVGMGDIDNQVAIAFVPNLRRDWLAGDRRAYDLVAAVYDCL